MLNKTTKESPAGLSSPSYLSCTVISSPLGQLGLNVNQGKLIKLSFLPETVPLNPAQDSKSQHIVNELYHYFANPNYIFNIDFQLSGTAFQQAVWRALLNIPCGQTLTYGELAQKLKTGPRAIGQACRTNPIPIIIPCHRIVAANHLGGYAGHSAGKMQEIKKWLLQHDSGSPRLNVSHPR